MIKTSKTIEVYTCSKCNNDYTEDGFGIYTCKNCGEVKCIICDGMADVNICVECYDKIDATTRAVQKRGYIYEIGGDLYRHENYYTKDDIYSLILESINNYADSYPEYNWEDYFCGKLGFIPVYPDFQYDFDFDIEILQENISDQK